MDYGDRANANNAVLRGAVGSNPTPMICAQNTAPREIGLMARVEGLNNGLQELESRLYAFCERISGNGSDKAGNPCPPPCGLPQSLTIAESHLRECLKMIGMLSEAF